jgi:hypothetical protein
MYLAFLCAGCSNNEQLTHYHYDNGQAISEIVCSNDTPYLIHYFENGRISSKAVIDKNNRLDGIVVGWDSIDNIRSVASYKKGLIHGRVDFYDSSGRIIESSVYKNGNKLVVVSRPFSSNLGNVLTQDTAIFRKMLTDSIVDDIVQRYLLEVDR